MFIHNRISQSGNGSNVCLKVPIKGDIEVSVAFDNSCGCLPNLSRIEARVYAGDMNITSQIFGGTGIGLSMFSNLVEVIDTVNKWVTDNV